MHTFLQENWLEIGSTIVGLISAVAGIFTFKANKRKSKAEMGLTIAEAHKEIWAKFLENPNLGRVTQDNVDLKTQPVTTEEEGFVFLILSHISSTVKAIELGQHISPEGHEEDIRNFFSKPIPKSVFLKHADSQPESLRDLLKEL